MPKVSRLEVITTGSRRRWTLEEKQRVVAESFSAPRMVSATARRHGLSNSQLFAWRRLARSGQLVAEDDGAGFVPAIVAPDALDRIATHPAHQIDELLPWNWMPPALALSERAA